MTWRINLSRDVAKQLEAIPPDRWELIMNDIREFADDPFPRSREALKSKALKGLYRKVSGRYRIISDPHR